MTDTISVPVDASGNILDTAGKIIGHIDTMVSKAAEITHAANQGVQAAAPVLDKAAQEAVAQSSGSAAVIDSLATHLGNAADNLATKIQQIVEHYGPGAAQLIHEIGRVKALSDVGTFLLAGAILAFGLINFFKAWNKFDQLERGDDHTDSYGLRIALFGGISLISLVVFSASFSLSALYGVFSPEAFLILKLIHL